jgi:hypothetical protein
MSVVGALGDARTLDHAQEQAKVCQIEPHRTAFEL